ncbi:VOC family protein [Aquimarina sp. 2201CG1-2-11]|uniref:VOC family protein n=1 Tax=Aquimarina discodermiae TaxID=3231043 RepID=UPI0034633627
MTPFHLAIPVANLEVCRQFYKEVLGCQEGRSDANWVDLNFFGHQLVIHQKAGMVINKNPVSNAVDGHQVPVPHFGVVLDWNDWITLSNTLQEKNIKFVIQPYIRFKGEVGEQATMFFYDPENNALEFKAFKNIDQLFAK